MTNKYISPARMEAAYRAAMARSGNTTPVPISDPIRIVIALSVSPLPAHDANDDELARLSGLSTEYLTEFRRRFLDFYGNDASVLDDGRRMVARWSEYLPGGSRRPEENQRTRAWIDGPIAAVHLIECGLVHESQRVAWQGEEEEEEEDEDAYVVPDTVTVKVTRDGSQLSREFFTEYYAGTIRLLEYVDQSTLDEIRDEDELRDLIEEIIRDEHGSFHVDNELRQQDTEYGDSDYVDGSYELDEPDLEEWEAE